MDGHDGLLAEVTSVEDARAALQRLLGVTRVAYERSSQLQRALESRVVIEQAKGVLAERYEIDIQAAFELLRKAARSNRMPLRDLAESVVGSRRSGGTRGSPAGPLLLASLDPALIRAAAERGRPPP